MNWTAASKIGRGRNLTAMINASMPPAFRHSNDLFHRECFAWGQQFYRIASLTMSSRFDNVNSFATLAPLLDVAAHPVANIMNSYKAPFFLQGKRVNLSHSRK
jgi:hypothetical protein